MVHRLILVTTPEPGLDMGSIASYSPPGG